MFIYSAVMKGIDIKHTVRTVGDYELFPRRVVGAVARILPVAEALSGGLLLSSRRCTLLGAGTCSVFGLVFSMLNWLVLRTGRSVPCGCGGSRDEGVLGHVSVMRGAAIFAGGVAVGLNAWRSADVASGRWRITPIVPVIMGLVPGCMVISGRAFGRYVYRRRRHAWAVTRDVEIERLTQLLDSPREVCAESTTGGSRGRVPALRGA